MGTPTEQTTLDYFHNIYPFWNLLKDIILLIDAEGGIEFANNEYLQLLNQKLAEVQFRQLSWCNFNWQEIKRLIEKSKNNQLIIEVDECVSEQKISLQFVQKLSINGNSYYLFQEHKPSHDVRISRALLNNPDIAFLSINKGFCLESFNQAAKDISCAIFQKELEIGCEVSGLLEGFPQPEKFESHYSNAFSGEYAVYVQNFSGSTTLDRWFEFQFTPILTGSQQVHGVAIVIRDISNYKNSDYEIRKSEEIFRNTFNNINDPALLWQLKEDQKIVMKTFNHAAEILSNEKIHEWLGTSIEQFFVNVSPVQDIIRSVFLTGNKISQEHFTKLVTTGEEKWFSSDYIKISEEYLLNISKDITARKQADLELAEKQRQYETLLKNLPGMAYRCKNDTDWTMEFVSEGSIALCGYSPQELINNNEIAYAQLIHPEDQSLVWDNVQNGLKRQKSFEMVYRIITKSAETKWVWEKGQGIEDEQGTFLALEGFISDITERVIFEKNAEKARRQAEALQEAMAELSSQLDLNQVLRRILVTLRKILDYDSAALFLKKEDKLTVVAARGFQNTARLINRSFPINSQLLIEIQSTRQPIILEDAQLDPRYIRWEGAELVRGWLCVPLVRHEVFIGFLTIDSYLPGAYKDEDALIAQTFADEAAIVIENARLYEKANELATSDGLTGIINRRYFYEIAKKEFERSQRYKNPLSIIMIDIDHFKYVNDSYGHAAGDQVLIQFVQRVLKELRSTDILCRYGGEEFAILLPETEIQEAIQAAERLREVVAADPFILQTAQSYITISLGVATNEADVSLLDVLIDRSDKALYESKQFGRNRVRSWRRSG